MNDLKEFIEQIKGFFRNKSNILCTNFIEKYKGKKITLISHDIGAAISSVLLTEHQDLVEKFVMANAPNPKTLKNVKINPRKMATTG